MNRYFGIAAGALLGLGNLKHGSRDACPTESMKVYQLEKSEEEEEGKRKRREEKKKKKKKKRKKVCHQVEVELAQLSRANTTAPRPLVAKIRTCCVQ